MSVTSAKAKQKKLNALIINAINTCSYNHSSQYNECIHTIAINSARDNCGRSGLPERKIKLASIYLDLDLDMSILHGVKTKWVRRSTKSGAELYGSMLC